MNQRMGLYGLNSPVLESTGPVDGSCEHGNGPSGVWILGTPCRVFYLG
jgi:hypothetical protein